MNQVLKEKLIKKSYIPLDKSWMIRMGVLDLVNGRDDSTEYLRGHSWKLSEDLKALYDASIVWDIGKTVDVGESATLYRFLKFASWKLGLEKKFITHGTLTQRAICNNPDIVNWPLRKLLKLDNETSQWASASVIMGNQERIENPPFKLKLTYEAVAHWLQKRSDGKCWEPRYDETILAQALTYLDILNHRKPIFIPQQPEDYCFARAFGFITKEEGEARWPSLHGHESDRIIEMEITLELAENGGEIRSKDHRVIQATAMLQRTRGRQIIVKHPFAVNKSWPEFLNFFDDSARL